MVAHWADSKIAPITVIVMHVLLDTTMILLTMRNVDSVPLDTFKMALPSRSARHVSEDITEVEVIA